MRSTCISIIDGYSLVINRRKTSHVVNFVAKICIMSAVKQLKVYGFGRISSTNCLKQITFDQKYLILQNHFQFGNSFANFRKTKAILMNAIDRLNIA